VREFLFLCRWINNVGELPLKNYASSRNYYWELVEVEGLCKKYDAGAALKKHC
jgi:hypothetical protein